MVENGGEFDDRSTTTALLLQQQSSSANVNHSLNRTGNVWTAVAHIITGVIGSGVLSLAWSVAQLGWVAGPLSLLLFGMVTLISAFLLSSCYRYPDPDHGLHRNSSYSEAVQTFLGNWRSWVFGILARFNVFKVGVVYTIASASSIRAIQKSNCYHKEGHGAACEYGSTTYMLLFGLVQVLASQIPDLHNAEWLSIIAAVMSFTYAITGSALGLAKVIENGEIQGSIMGVPTNTGVQKVWLVGQALGDIAFSYPYSLILLEIQDTLKSPPSEKVTMQKASIISVFATTCFYLSCGGFGYAAFGDSTPGNLLTGFGFYEPYWLIDFTNACVVLHLVGGYQVYSQALFLIVDRGFAENYPDSGFGNDFYSLKLPLLPTFRVNLLRLVFRSSYVILTTGTAMIFPYFNQVMAVAGALTFWPVAVYFPVEMYFVQKNVRPWTTTWVALRTYCILCFLVALFALAGSIEGLVTQRIG